MSIFDNLKAASQCEVVEVVIENFANGKSQTVFVKKFSESQAAKYQKSQQRRLAIFIDKDGKPQSNLDKSNQVGMKADLIAEALVEEDGTQVFDKKTKEAIEDWDSKQVEKLFNACFDHCGIADTAEEIEKK